MWLVLLIMAIHTHDSTTRASSSMAAEQVDAVPANNEELKRSVCAYTWVRKRIKSQCALPPSPPTVQVELANSARMTVASCCLEVATHLESLHLTQFRYCKAWHGRTVEDTICDPRIQSRPRIQR